MPLPETLADLRTALEELQVAEEELRVQNEELTSSRAEIAAEHRRYQELFDFAPDGYLVTSPHGIIREANRAIASLLNLSARFLEGKPLANFVPDAERRSFRLTLAALTARNQPSQWIVTLQRRGGRNFSADLSVAAVRNAHDEVVALRWLVRDRTERAQAEERIRKLNTELEQRIDEVMQRTAQLAEANRTKDELLAREHKIAETLQRALLPPMLHQLPGIAVHASYRPSAAEAEVGGDWYDAFPMPDGRIAFAIGDVAGIGLHGAVTMGLVRQAIRTAAIDQQTPSAILTRAAKVLDMNPSREIVTVTFGILDPVSMAFTYATAGHPPPILAADRDARLLSARGLPLGTEFFTPPPDWSLSLSPGTLLVLYTDGVLEHGKGVVGGEAALLAAVRTELESPSANPAVAIHERILSGTPPRDDVAVLTVSLAPFPADELDLTLPTATTTQALVRQALRRFAAAVAADEHVIFDMQVAVGEAVSNVITHAYGVGSGTVAVRAHRREDRLLIEVHDTGRWRPSRGGHGRGLTFMRALADDAKIDSTPDGTTVRLEFLLGQRNIPH